MGLVNSRIYKAGIGFDNYLDKPTKTLYEDLSRDHSPFFAEGSKLMKNISCFEDSRMMLMGGTIAGIILAVGMGLFLHQVGVNSLIVSAVSGSFSFVALTATAISGVLSWKLHKIKSHKITKDDINQLKEEYRIILSRNEESRGKIKESWDSETAFVETLLGGKTFEDYAAAE